MCFTLSNLQFRENSKSTILYYVKPINFTRDLISLILQVMTIHKIKYLQTIYEIN